MRTKIPLWILLALSMSDPSIVTAQKSSTSTVPTMSDSARTYLETALQKLQETSRHGGSVNWQQIRDSAFTLAAGAQTLTDTYGAINWALDRVDPHSFLSGRIVGNNSRLLRGKVGYLWVRSYNGPAQAPLTDTLQSHLRRLESQGACGWIIDVRHNGGGNIWPMLAGIGPLLGDSIASVSTSVDGSYRAIYSGGHALQAGPGTERQVFTRVANPLVMRNPLAPVAVLINGQTGSSGAGIALAFAGRPNTRFFGQPTSNTTTVNSNIGLPNGAEMIVTTGVMGDRTGRKYGVPLEPDETIVLPESVWPSPVDAVARRAAEWLETQAACTSG